MLSFQGCEEEDPFDVDYEVKANKLNSEIFERQAWDAFKDSTLDDFMENPFAIDPFIPGWMRLLLGDIKSKSSSKEKIAASFLSISRVLYGLCKVRGEKSISIYFPCDIRDLPQFIDLYHQQVSDEEVVEEDSWKVKYVLLLWVGQYSKQPFDLSKSLSLEYKAKLSSLIEDIKPLATSSLLGKPACIVLARLGTSDINSMHYFNELSKIKPLEHSVLCTLKAKNPIELGLLCKIYKRCDYGLNELVTNVFHKDGSVRYTAAKCAAHLISKAANSEEIISNILTFLSKYTSYNGTDLANTFHGGALMLGELFKSRLVSESQLDVCQELIGKFLEFEYCKGTFALGATVRDAGCYAVWSLARYLPDRVEGDICHRLIFMSLFDREVGCRRAAAAAFQELIGRTSAKRLKGFMEMLQFINFTTANMHPQEALEQILLGYGEYCRSYFIPQFISKCIMHWDSRKRKQSALLLPLLEKHYPAEVWEALRGSIPGEEEEYSKIHGFYFALAHLTNCKTNCEDGLVKEAYKRILTLNKNDVGFELLSEAYLTLLAHHPPVQADHFEYIVGCLLCKNSEISELAAKALEANLENWEDRKKVEEVCRTFLPKADKSMDPLGRIGYARALGAIPKDHPNPGPFLRLSLKLAERLAERSGDYLERLTALQSHHRLLQKTDLTLVKSFVEGWEERMIRLGYDWTRDTRGDVGSFIRSQVLRILTTCRVKSIPAEALAWRMACERMDKVRLEAVTFLKILGYDIPLDCTFGDTFFRWLHRSIQNLNMQSLCRMQMALGLISVITGFGKPYENIQGLLNIVIFEHPSLFEMIDNDFDQKLYKKYLLNKVKSI